MLIQLAEQFMYTLLANFTYIPAVFPLNKTPDILSYRHYCFNDKNKAIAVLFICFVYFSKTVGDVDGQIHFGATNSLFP